jgi:flagellar basal-body rod modification protein FlgD
MSVGTDFDWGVSTVQQRAIEAAQSSSSSMSQDDFLQLLVCQLTNQDPLSPLEDIDFTEQLAQLQALEEQISMNSSIAALLLDNQLQSATGMIGSSVAGVDSDGNSVTGVVTGAAVTDGEVYIEFASGQRVLAADVFEVTGSDSSIAQEVSASIYAIGMWVEAGYDSALQPIQGIVETVSVHNGVVRLDLYGGENVSWDQVTLMRAPTDSESLYTLPDDVREQLETAQGVLGYMVTGSDESGNSVTGLVANAELDASTVFLLLYDGTRLGVETLVGEKSLPDAGIAEAALVGLWAIGYDSVGGEVSGLIVGAEDRDDGLSLKLAGGGSVYYDMLTEIRDATSDELAAAEAGRVDSE